MVETRSVAEWLIDGARTAATPQAVLEQLCSRLVDGGIPLWRVGVFVQTLHPDIIGRSFRWRADTGVEIGEARFDILETDE